MLKRDLYIRRWLSALVSLAIVIIPSACSTAVGQPIAKQPSAPVVSSVTSAAVSPVKFDISLFGAGGLIQPSVANLTAKEEAELRNLVPVIFGNFSAYLFSGCQNRAHAAFLLLPEHLKAKAMKIWVLSPGVYSVGFVGLITLKDNRAERKDVSWGFHVALAFRTNTGDLIVLDGGLTPDRIVSQPQWFNEMVFPTLALWTLTKPDVYQFNTWNVDPYDTLKPVNPAPWSGRFFQDLPDNGINRDNFLKELARDVVGADALQGKVCSALTQMLKDPGVLQKALDGPVFSGCEQSFQRYNEAQPRLRKLLFR